MKETAAAAYLLRTFDSGDGSGSTLPLFFGLFRRGFPRALSFGSGRFFPLWPDLTGRVSGTSSFPAFVPVTIRCGPCLCSRFPGFRRRCGRVGISADDLRQLRMDNRSCHGFRQCRGLPRRLCARVFVHACHPGFPASAAALFRAAGDDRSAAARQRAYVRSGPDPSFRFWRISFLAAIRPHAPDFRVLRLEASRGAVADGIGVMAAEDGAETEAPASFRHPGRDAGGGGDDVDPPVLVEGPRREGVVISPNEQLQCKYGNAPGHQPWKVAEFRNS